MGNTESEIQGSQDASLRSRGINRMHPHIQRKLQQGTGYQMKIVIRGARETGKTSLLRRLEGKSFIKAHIPSPQIQVAHIDWNYKTTSDLVQVQVWDVVDKGIAQPHDPRIRSLIAQGKVRTDAVPKAIVADASTVDVYKNCHAVLMVFDPSRRWTFEYIHNEVGKVPSNKQILLMANFRDLHQRRQVSEVEIENFLRGCDNNVNYIECCMMNGYGLKQVYNWLNIPFLMLKQESLENELKRAQQELKTAKHEAQLVQEQDYESYLKLVNMQMKLQNRPPIPDIGPIPTSQKPGTSAAVTSSNSQAQASTERPGRPMANPSVLPQPLPKSRPRKSNKKSAESKSSSEQRSSVRSSNKRNPRPNPNPALPSNRTNKVDDELDNFNAGELTAGFFDDDDDDEPEPKVEVSVPQDEQDDSDSEDDDDHPQDDPEEAGFELEEQEAIQTNAYGGIKTDAKRAKAGREIKGSSTMDTGAKPKPQHDYDHEDDHHDQDEDQEPRRIQVLSDPVGVEEKDSDDESQDLDHFVPPPNITTAGLGGGAEARGNTQEKDDILDGFVPAGSSAAAPASINNPNSNPTSKPKASPVINPQPSGFVAPAGDSLKGFYSDNDDDDHDEGDQDDLDDTQGRFELKGDKKPRSTHLEQDTNFHSNTHNPTQDLKNYNSNPTTSAPQSDFQPIGGGGYGEFKEVQEFEDKPKKKKKKKKKSKSNEDNNSAISSGKRKKKKKKKKERERTNAQ